MTNLGKTVGYTRPVEGKLSLNKNPKKPKPKWLAKKPAEKFGIEKHMFGPNGDTRTGLYKAELRAHDLEHDRDFYRIGGGPVNVIGRDNTRFGETNPKTGKPQYTRGRNLRAPQIATTTPSIGWARDAKGKIIAESKANTLASSQPVNLPFGSPGEMPNVRDAGPGARNVKPFMHWKSAATSYNSALSRQQQAVAQVGNSRLQKLNPIVGASPLPSRTTYPAPGVKRPS